MANQRQGFSLIPSSRSSFRSAWIAAPIWRRRADGWMRIPTTTTGCWRRTPTIEVTRTTLRSCGQIEHWPPRFRTPLAETRKERYEGVIRQMFERAIEALDVSYVHSIDYEEMARAAVKRCDLRAQVISVAFPEGLDSNSVTSSHAPSRDKVNAWSVALAGASGPDQGISGNTSPRTSFCRHGSHIGSERHNDAVCRRQPWFRILPKRPWRLWTLHGHDLAPPGRRIREAHDE